MVHAKKTAAFWILANAVACTFAHADAVTTKSLVGELTDLNRLAEFPSPAYVTKQFSSRDQSSTTPDDAKTWFANHDWDQWQGTATHGGREERILAKADGPGAIMRIWTANPAGTLRVYLDGGESPVIEATMADLLGGKVKGIPSPIAGEQGKGFNLYLPIAYAKSCEVTTDNKGFYYHVDYRTYASGTEVTTLKPADLDDASSEIAKAAKGLESPSGIAPQPGGDQKFDTHLNAGESKTIVKLEGARAINSLKFHVPPDITEAALRAAVLRITFDGETTVEVPLGDFFAAAPGLNAYDSLPFSVTKSGEMTSRWVMPFQTSATVELKNLGQTPITLSGEVGSVARPWTDGSLHFNAGYRAEADRKSQPQFDWNYLTANGKGRFVGTSFTIDNPVKGWWGEGDEKFYVDGEKMPSWFGTGTEDYFAYAWGYPAVFQHAYHSQPRADGPDNYGRTSVNRFHIVDDVPFTNQFKFDMEIWHSKKCQINFTATSYWYATPGSTDAFKELDAKAVAVHQIPAFTPFRVANAIEGEDMKIIEHAAIAEPQVIDGTSGDRHLWWKGAKEGEKLVVHFTVAKAGTYHVRASLLKAHDYGIAKLAINGKAVGDAIDFYAPDLIVGEESDLGVFDLKAGENELSVTNVGANPAATADHMFGLDYLLLKDDSQ